MSAIAPSIDPLQQLEDTLRRDIPLARMMDLRIVAFDGNRVTLTAPLAPNVNDKGCAFGGSLASVMTIAGWALANLAIRHHGIDADIYVQDSQIRYLAPVWGELRTTAWLAEGESLVDFLSMLESRGKARLTINAEIIGEDGKPATTLTGRYVALAMKD